MSALARATGLSQPTISLIEASQRTPSVETARLIAEALGVTVGTLMGESMEGLTPEETQFVRDFLSLPAHLRAEMRSFMDFLRARRLGDRPEQ